MGVWEVETQIDWDSLSSEVFLGVHSAQKEGDRTKGGPPEPPLRPPFLEDQGWLVVTGGLLLWRTLNLGGWRGFKLLLLLWRGEEGTDHSVNIHSKTMRIPTFSHLVHERDARSCLRWKGNISGCMRQGGTHYLREKILIRPKKKKHGSKVLNNLWLKQENSEIKRWCIKFSLNQYKHLSILSLNETVTPPGLFRYILRFSRHFSSFFVFPLPRPCQLSFANLR